MATPGGKTLFTLPINPAGSITVTEPAPATYLLTFSSPPDNRLVTAFCQPFLLALDIIEARYPPGVLITTSAIPKFYSNGLNLDHASTTPGFYVDSLYKLFARLASFPMPTVSWLNGHAFAGGLMLAMHHDYRVFNPSRGFLCLNELDFGAPLKPAMLGIFEAKASPAVYRSLVLEAKRFTGNDALAAELVDRLGAWEGVLALVEERKLTMRAKSGVYGVMKQEMYRHVIANLEGHEARVEKDKADAERLDNIAARTEQRVRAWERQSKENAKL